MDYLFATFRHVENLGARHRVERVHVVTRGQVLLQIEGVGLDVDGVIAIDLEVDVGVVAYHECDAFSCKMMFNGCAKNNNLYC